MVHTYRDDPCFLGGWAQLLWRMLRYLDVPREDLPYFHAQDIFVHGKFHCWKGGLMLRLVKARPLSRDTESERMKQDWMHRGGSLFS